MDYPGDPQGGIPSADSASKRAGRQMRFRIVPWRFKRGRARGKDDERVTVARVEIYTKMLCGYCTRAKRLLDAKGVEYTEYDITWGGEKRAEMLGRKPDARTVPQIFIGDRAIGGSDDLAALDRAGKLDEMLGL